MEPIDPTVEQTVEELRAVIEWCYEGLGKLRIGEHKDESGVPQDRMAERGFTGMEIENTLRKGALRTESCNAGVWRYEASRRDARIIFCFDVDSDGNVLVIVTLIRRTP
jgi:hypothetical protein